MRANYYLRAVHMSHFVLRRTNGTAAIAKQATRGKRPGKQVRGHPRHLPSDNSPTPNPPAPFLFANGANLSLPKPKKYFMSTRQVCMTGVYRYSLKHAIESNIRYTLAPLSGIRVELDDRVRQNV